MSSRAASSRGRIIATHAVVPGAAGRCRRGSRRRRRSRCRCCRAGRCRPGRPRRTPASASAGRRGCHPRRRCSTTTTPATLAPCRRFSGRRHLCGGRGLPPTSSTGQGPPRWRSSPKGMAQTWTPAMDPRQASTTRLLRTCSPGSRTASCAVGRSSSWAAPTRTSPRMVRRKELVVLHPGVYVDHTGAPSRHQLEWASVLFYWPAALTRESALPTPSRTGQIHVAVDRRTVKPLRGITVHRTTDLESRAHHQGPPRLARARRDRRGGGARRRACRLPRPGRGLPHPRDGRRGSRSGSAHASASAVARCFSIC